MTSTEGSTEAIADEEEEPYTPPSDRHWWQRDSMRRIRQDTLRSHSYRDSVDIRDNVETKPPTTELINLGGLMLVEAFTPSTINNLYEGLRRMPSGSRAEQSDEIVESVIAARSSSTAGGWKSLGIVRRSGDFVMGDGFHDDALPAGVDAVWLRLIFATPSLTLLVATFSLSESTGDLSPILNANYKSQITDLKIRVDGFLGTLRSHLPWARPKRYRISHKMPRVEDAKRNQYERFASATEQAAWTWLRRYFCGKFARQEMDQRPCIRVLLTNEVEPFTGTDAWLRPVGLSTRGVVWKSDECKGWAFDLDRFGFQKRRLLAVAAARRSDAAQDQGASQDGSTNWYLTQRFHDEQSNLFARLAITLLLSIYADGLARLRDDAARKGRFYFPVKRAKALDRFLLGDGIDLSTVASDVDHFTDDLLRFRWDVAEYREQYSFPLKKDQKPSELVPGLRESLRRDAQRLRSDVDTTTRNIAASAELRQSIANTRLQRAILTLTVVAIVVAVVGVFAA